MFNTHTDTHAHSTGETLHHHDLQMCMCKDCQSTSLMCCCTSPWHHCSYHKLGQAIYITERRMRERDLEGEERESSGAGECRHQEEQKVMQQIWDAGETASQIVNMTDRLRQSEKKITEMKIILFQQQQDQFVQYFQCTVEEQKNSIVFLSIKLDLLRFQCFSSLELVYTQHQNCLLWK